MTFLAMLAGARPSRLDANLSLYPAGAPGPPGEPFITRYGTALTIHWSSGDPGRAPITRYVIEARPSGAQRHAQMMKP